MTWIVALPVLVPLACAAIAVLVRRAPALQHAVALLGTAGLVASASACLVGCIRGGPLAIQIGGWDAPFAIAFVADALGSTLAVITGLLGLATVAYARGSPDVAPRRAPLFFPLALLTLAGVAGAFLTGDLFNLYVWFELMLVGSFGLLIVGTRPAQLDGALKYVVLNVIATTLLLLAIALTYGMAGTLSLAELAVRMPASDDAAITTAIAALFIVAFGMKAAVFPLYFWLPPAYPTTSFAASALLAGLLTKVGVYGLYRVLIFVFPTELESLAPWVGAIAALTMMSGVLGAVASTDVRTILSFHIVSQIGYMLMPLSMVGRAALASGVFYVVHHIIVKSNLFFVSGLAARAAGSSDLSRARGGLLHTRPLLAVLFAIPAASLAGIPPLSGFWAKLMVVRAGLDADQIVLVIVALFTSVLTLYSMTKIWQALFWGEPHEAAPHERRNVPAPVPSGWTYGPALALALVTASIGLWPEPLVRLAELVAAELVDRDAYIAAALEGGS